MKSYNEQRVRYLKSVLDMRKAGYSYGHISKIFPVPKATIRHWCTKFAEDTSKSTQMKRNPVTMQQMQEKETNADCKALQQRIKELEAQLKKESIRADFYDEMINVAEAKFNISIRKKAGTKQ